MVDRRKFLKVSVAGVASLALPAGSFGRDTVEEAETKLYSDWSAMIPRYEDVRLFSDQKAGVFGLRADKKWPYEWQISLSDVRSALKRPGVLITTRLISLPVLTRTDTMVRSSLMKIGVLAEREFSTPGYGSRFALIDVPDSFEMGGNEYTRRKWLPCEAVHQIVSGSDHE